MSNIDKRINYMYKTCLSKRKYRTLDYALKEAKKIEEKFGQKHYVYKCPMCLFYHTTTHKHDGAYYYND